MLPSFVWCKETGVSPDELFSWNEKLFLSEPGRDSRGLGFRSFMSMAAFEESDDDTCMNGGIMKNGDCNCPDASNFTGLRCEMCQRDDVCAAQLNASGMCQHGLAIRGSSTQFECSLNSPFLSILGGGRAIEAVVVVNCSKEDGTAFAVGEEGVCSFTLFRIEPHREFVDPFFHCNTSECSMQLAVQNKAGESSDTPKPSRAFKAVVMTGQVVLVSLCALIALLRFVSFTLGYRRKAKIVVGLGVSLTVSTILFISVMLILMRSESSDVYAVYRCKQTECQCSKDPPKGYDPVCSKSLVGNKILPLIKNSILYACNLRTHHCQLTMEDITLVFDLECNASECVDTNKFPNEPKIVQPETAQAQRDLLFILTLVLTVLVLLITAHALWLRSVSRKRAAEFVRMFGVSELQPQLEKQCSLDVVSNGSGSSTKIPLLEKKGSQQQNRLSLRGDSAEEDVSSSNGAESIGLSFQRHSSGSHMTSDARRILIAMPDEADRIEYFRRLTKSRFELELTDLAYSLPGSRFAAKEETRTRPLLNRVNFTVRSGEVLAILGPSGAGKTTLLDLLSARSKQGRTTGTISLNGTPINTASAKSINQYRNIIGYVSQEDTLLPALTVRQTIEYAARLKLPQAFSNTTIKSIVRHMIEALRLQQCEHTVIGDGSGLRGVSGGEKRRVSIAVELLANPRILFLDEPTSGLDAVSAKRVMESVVELAKESPMQAYAPHYFAFKPIVIFSIHQPSQEIFELFDKILLLSHGVSIYCGQASIAAETLEKRIERIVGGAKSVPRSADYPNHAEYLMKLEDILDDSTRMEIQADDVSSSFGRMHHEGTEFFREPRENNGINGVSECEPLVEGEDILRNASTFHVYYANVYQQLSLLSSRAACCLISSFHLILCHAAVTTSLGVLMMVLYHDQKLDLPGALNRAGSITFMLLVFSFVSLSCLEQLVVERKLFVVERENGFYRTLPYLLSKVFIDILPLRIIPAMVLASLIYFPMGLRVDDGVHFFWFVVIVVLFSTCITLIVLCIGIITGSFGAAALLSSVFILWNFVFGGFLVQSETVPAALQPFQKMSPFFAAFEALLVNELDGQACTFSPTDETGKPSSTSIPIMCLQYLSNIGLKPKRFNTDVAQLAGSIFVLLCIAWLLLAKFTSIAR
ncbi:ABC transporter, putative [Trypanosoma cruzi marinkellei]|uniref:ABC transporter, putative n=1 Tax=Trypanosoma cruzi marinkellei TaxID=85056 RepID=K2ND48_TRYCR|nr:ABC transporter, putative [Trypanosoma cruzi marinkellei]